MLRGSGKPKPFQRKSITVSTDALGSGAKKEWQDVDPRAVEVGDIILGKGLVVGLGDAVRVQDPAQFFFHFEMKNGTTHREEGKVDWMNYHPGSEVSFLPTVRAFTRVRG